MPAEAPAPPPVVLDVPPIETVLTPRAARLLLRTLVRVAERNKPEVAA